MATKNEALRVARRLAAQPTKNEALRVARWLMARVKACDRIRAETGSPSAAEDLARFAESYRISASALRHAAKHLK